MIVEIFICDEPNSDKQIIIHVGRYWREREVFLFVYVNNEKHNINK